MLLLFILSFSAASLAVAVSTNPPPPDSADDDCPIILERKTLDWDFILTPDPLEPRPISYYDLTAPGAGFVWRGEAYYHADITRPILFQNGQGWRLVNCSSYFGVNDPVKGGCTTPEFALLSIPGINIGDAPPDKGKIGTIHALAYPNISSWAVYDLIEFHITPMVPVEYLQELITVEVFGWREDGTTVATLRIKIKGSDVGYKVALPKGWDTILQWQVRVWWSAGNRATRQEFQYLIGDVVINEHALGSVDFNCRYPMQTPTGPPEALVTLTFDDIPTLNSSAAPPRPYHGYIFDDKYGSWNVTNHLSYPVGSPGRLSASTNPNVLLGTPRDRKFWSQDPNVITTPDFLFDVDSFHISIDNSTTLSQDPAHILIIISAFGACSVDILNSYNTGAAASVEAPNYSFDVDLTRNFKKYRAVTIYALDDERSMYIPFWIDSIVVRSWENALGVLPGCERCGRDMESFCEYPIPDRPQLDENTGM